MKYHHQVTDAWIGISISNTNLANEKGYLIFVRDDRLATGLGSPLAPAKLSTGTRPLQ